MDVKTCTHICPAGLHFSLQGFTLTVATPYNFLVRFLKAAGVNKCPETVYLATYLVELSLPTYGMLKYRYSAIACAAVYTAMRAGGRTAAQAFPKALASHSGYSEAETLPVAAQLVQLMQQASTAALLAVSDDDMFVCEREIVCVWLEAMLLGSVSLGCDHLLVGC